MADVDDLFNCFNEQDDASGIEPPIAISENTVVASPDDDIETEK